MQPLQLLQQVLHTVSVLKAKKGILTSPSTLDKAMDIPTFAFSEHWQLLGPFQIGTREALWGADPLELYGGFRNLTFDDHARFPSSLPFNGTAFWSNATAKLGGLNIQRASVELTVEYPDVDWAFLQQVYGWAALQWQGWVRGEIVVQREDPITLSLDAENILEYWIDDKQYLGGDFYGFKRAPAVLHLDPGVYKIDVRLVRDVRSMGGITENPAVNIKLELEACTDRLRQVGRVLIADRIEEAAGLLASNLASVVLRNNLHDETIWINSIQTRPSSRNACKTYLVHDTPVMIAPGQSRPVAFRVACVPGTSSSNIMEFEITHHVSSREEERLPFLVTVVPKPVRSRHDPQKFTYLHPGGMASYAVLRPPSPSALASCNATNGKLPVLLALHGAGLEADDDLVRHALDPLANICAWVLFPTGVTPWSGDDWHIWGSADVEAAVNAIPEWIEHNSWSGPGVDTERWLVIGHSNGGQGTWHLLTHRPDKVIAAAPLSGYSSIQNYVPYDFWRIADPRKAAIVQASLGSYRHELLLENTKYVPILLQHGSADDNVPAYHSRLMHQLLSQSESESTYHEMDGKPHYWDGVMTTQPLSNFIERHLAQEADRANTISRLDTFTVTTMNPADTGSLHGIRILGLIIPGQKGRVEVTAESPHSYTLFTSNVRVLEIASEFSKGNTIYIDDQTIEIRKGPDSVICKLSFDGMWIISDEKEYNELSNLRHGRQLGSIDSILRTKGAFQIVPHPSKHAEAVEHTALQISRNLCQYFSADTEIIANVSETANNRTGNVISVYLGVDIPDQPHYTNAAHHAITIHQDRVVVRNARGSKRTYRSRKDGLAAIYLRPLPNERLELIVWGVDAASLQVAARLVPMMTGVGVPDFVLADSNMLWKGVEGTLAMGFLDENWNVSSNAILS
jgi:predicted esterase